MNLNIQSDEVSSKINSVAVYSAPNSNKKSTKLTPQQKNSDDFSIFDDISCKSQSHFQIRHNNFELSSKKTKKVNEFLIKANE